MARAPALQEIEELPEADRLEGFPHPRETKVLFGHADAERALAQSFASGRLHHGWMIAGREGIGKATLAYRFARFLLAKPEERDPAHATLHVDEATAAARQVRALSHPGLLLIRRQWDATRKRFGVSIPVDEVRRLRGFLAHTADVGAWRVVIVDTADDLNLECGQRASEVAGGAAATHRIPTAHLRAWKAPSDDPLALPHPAPDALSEC